MNKIAEQWLQRFYENAQISEGATDWSKITSEMLCGIGGSSITASSFDMGWYELLHNQDISRAKQCFFRSGKLACWLANHCKKDSLTTGHALIAVLLSDNADLISSYADSTAPVYEYMVTRSTAVFDKLAQLHLKDDVSGIKRYMEVAQNKVVPKHKYSLPIFEFYKSLEEGDMVAMEIHINSMLSLRNHKYLNRDDRYADLFSFPAVKCAKLAWVLGFKVCLGSLLIPNKILPIEPLPVYEDYPFFN